MILLDANVILRYLLNDHEQMSAQAEKYIQEENACMTIEVAAEVVYVLRRVYSVERNKISESVKCILNQISCTEPDVLQEALSIYGETSLDFVDCVLCAYHAIKGYEIRTFDKKLMKRLKQEQPDA